MRLTDTHRTAPADAAVHASGWVPLDDTWEVTALPLVDTRVTGLLGELVLARLTPAEAHVVAAREGAQLPTPAQVALLHTLATRGEAVEVPAYTGTPVAESTIDHTLRHDRACWAALIAAGWWWFGGDDNPALPTANVGKHWTLPLGSLAGWWVRELARYTPAPPDPAHRSGPGFVQLPSGHRSHNGAHHDDGTTTLLVRRRRPVDAPEDDRTGSASSAPTEAASGAPGADGGIVAEVEIGPPLRFAGDGRSRFPDDAPEARPARPPHGYRCSVRELVEDARALGTWVDLMHVCTDPVSGGGYVVRPGDAIVSRRYVDGAWRDPRQGERGHVETVVEIMSDWTLPITIGGNEANTWVRATYDLDDPALAGVIRCPDALRARVVELARQELAAGIRERPGPAAHPRIQEYHAGARRGGSPRAGMPGHESEGASVLGARASDEVAWCASSRSWLVREALRAHGAATPA